MTGESHKLDLASPLDRMVARTRGLLPSVRPVIQPLYASSTLGDPPLPSGIQEEHASKTGAGSERSGLRNPEFGNVHRSFLLPGPVPEVRGALQPIGDRLPPEHAERSGMERVPPAHQEGREVSPAPHSTLSRHASHAERNSGVSPSLPISHAAPERKNPAAELSRQKDREAQKAPANLGKQPGAADTPALGDRPMAPSPAPSGESEGRSAEPPPEIRISIGAIELKAAAEPRPRPAGFRPKVTLQEFLGRRGGGRP